MTCPVPNRVCRRRPRGAVLLSARAQFSYKTGVDVAGFTVTVVNRAGETVTDLKADDFDVREDGVVQSVTYFSDLRGPKMRCPCTSGCCSTPARAWRGIWRFRGTRRSSS